MDIILGIPFIFTAAVLVWQFYTLAKIGAMND